MTISGAPIVPKTILTASDFPTPGQVITTRSQFQVLASVTDNDPTRTNTGDAFVADDYIVWDGSGWNKINGSSGGSGTVTSVSVVSANGLAGTVATATTTPAITLSTTVTGLLKGNGSAISAATPGTDYGDVSGPASATDNAFPRFDTATGKLLQNGQTIEDDSGNVVIAGTLAVNGGTITSPSALNLNPTGDINLQKDVHAQIFYLSSIRGASSGNEEIKINGGNPVEFPRGFTAPYAYDGSGTAAVNRSIDFANRELRAAGSAVASWSSSLFKLSPSVTFRLDSPDSSTNVQYYFEDNTTLKIYSSGAMHLQPSAGGMLIDTQGSGPITLSTAGALTLTGAGGTRVNKSIFRNYPGQILMENEADPAAYEIDFSLGEYRIVLDSATDLTLSFDTSSLPVAGFTTQNIKLTIVQPEDGTIAGVTLDGAYQETDLSTTASLDQRAYGETCFDMRCLPDGLGNFYISLVPENQIMPSIYGISTTDATLTTLATIPIPTNKTVNFTGSGKARQSGGVGGTAGNSGGCFFSLQVKNIAGTASIITGSDANNNIFSEFASTGTCYQFSVSGANLIVKVLGEVDCNIDWELFVTLLDRPLP